MQQVEWLSMQEAMKRTRLSHSAILIALGRTTLIGTSIDGNVLVLASSVDRFAKRMATDTAAVGRGRQ